MTVTKFDPFALIGTSLFNDFNRLFEPTGTQPDTWVPRVDIAETDGSFMVRAELPGVAPDSIDVTIDDNVLTISGSLRFTSVTDDETEAETPRYRRREIRQGSFARKIRLQAEVDIDGIVASSNDGILEVIVPKQPAELPRKVTVAVQR